MRLALTGRETEVVALLAKGYRLRQVAIRLGISYGTARTHVNNVARRLPDDAHLPPVAAVRNYAERERLDGISLDAS